MYGVLVLDVVQLLSFPGDAVGRAIGCTIGHM